MTSQNIYSLHTPAKRILSDTPNRPPPPPSPSSSPSSPRTSNPTPATFLLLLALQQMALSLQTMCPFRNSVLPSASGSKVSEAPRDLPPQQICADPHRTCRRELRKQNKTKKHLFPLLTKGKQAGRGGNPNRPTFMQCNCPHSSYQFLLGVLMGAHICPPPSPPPSSILASAGDA